MIITVVNKILQKSSCKLKLTDFSLYLISNINWFDSATLTFDWSEINLSILKERSLVAFVAGNTRISFTIVITSLISTSNHVLGRGIWDKLPKCIFQNVEITRVKRGQFHNLQKSRGWFFSKIARTKHVITG